MAKGGGGGYCRNTPPEVENLAKYPPWGWLEGPPFLVLASRSEAKIHQKSCKIARKRREIGKFCDISSKIT